MKREDSEYLKGVAKRSGYDFDRRKKRSFLNPLKNSMFREMIYIALRYMEQISVQTMDWKLTAITKLLQAWVDDREYLLDNDQEMSQPDYSEFTDTNNYL